MSTLAERVADLIAEKREQTGQTNGQIVRELAAHCGIKPPSIYDWTNGTTKNLQGTNLIRAAEFFGVTTDWLASGTGQRRAGEKPSARQEWAQYISADKYVYIPVYSGVRAGMGDGGAVEHEEVSGKHSYSQKWLIEQGLDAARLCRIRGHGRSMEPTIADGDTLLVNLAERTIKDGRVYAFRVGDEVKVKRLFRQMDGRVRVVSDNVDKALYPDEFLSIDAMPEIIGRVRDRSGSANL